MDCSSVSEAERVCECDDGDQWPKDRNPIFFMEAGDSCVGRSALDGDEGCVGQGHEVLGDWGCGSCGARRKTGITSVLDARSDFAALYSG